MNLFKRVAAVLLALVLIVPVTVSAASPAKTKLPSTITPVNASLTYNGANRTANTLKNGSKKIVNGTDYKITKITCDGKTVSAIKNAGKYVLTVKGIGKYTGTATVTFTVKKASPQLKTTVAKKTYKVKKVKKAKKSFKIGATSKTKKTYKVKGNKYAKKHIKVSKTGKVTVKKGTKKGTYKIVVTSRATKNYKKATKTIKVVVK